MILLFLIFVLFLILNKLNPLLFWDENAYLSNARSHISKSNFTEDHRFPLLEYIISVVWLITGESILSAKLLMIFFSLGTIFIFYKISQIYFNEKAIIPTIFFSLCPLFLEWGSKVYTDVPALFFLTLAFYLILKKKILLAGVFSGFGFLTKFPFAIFAFSVGIFFIYKKEFKKILFFSSGFLISIAPWLIYNYITYRNPLWDIIVQFNVIKIWTYTEPILKQIINIIRVMGILALFVPFGFYDMIKKKKYRYWQIILIHTLIFFVYYFFFVNLKFSRYYLANLSFLYFISFAGILFLTKKYKRGKKIVYLLVVASIIISLLIFIKSSAVVYKCDKEGPMKQTIEFLKENTNKDDLIVSNVWPFFGYYNNLKVMSIWDENISFIMEEFNPKFVVYSNIMGTKFNKTILDQNLKLEKEITGNCYQKVYIYKTKKLRQINW